MTTTLTAQAASHPRPPDHLAPSSPVDVPVAVIGIGCRFAGGIDSAQTMWDVLAEGRDMVTEVPPHRWDIDAVYDSQPGVGGRTATRWGGFVDDVSGFEPEYFGLTDREASLIDPQFRLLLETSCEALEHAGYAPRGLRGSQTAVFAGCSYEDYMDMIDLDRGLRHPDAVYGIIGTARFTASSRLAYLLDLRGPAVTIDTACSSGLVAVHLAAQALRAGDADLALAGGVMLSLLAKNTLVFSTMGVLTTGQGCRAFAAGGDGYVRGEGCGMVALKRLPDALDAGDRILAVLRGTGINNNGGRSETMLSPSVAGQQELFTRVLDRAGVDPAGVALIEAHGPGTPVGDPIEYASLRAAYGPHGVPCALGSVKTNIGHCEVAAGIAGLIKAVLAVQHGQIPANLHFSEWNPEIDPRGARFYVPTALTPWPESAGSRIATVCSYGMSGTNAHAVLEQAPGATRRSGNEDHDGLRLYPLSAGSEPALAATAGRVADWLTGAGAGVPLRDVAYTLAHRREHRRSRAVLAAAGRAELAQRLRRLATGRSDPVTWTGLAFSTGPSGRGPVWVFSAQGSQWSGMGRELLAAEPAFARTVAEIEPLVQAESGFSVRETMTAGEMATGVARVQPTLFAMQVALAAAWRVHGVEPAAVIGHSMGEVAAATVAGGLSLADGVRVICRRSRLCAELAGQGTMALVALPADEVEAALPDAVSIAAISAPASTVVSGPVSQLEALVTAWQQQDVMAAPIAVDYSSHHAVVDAILPGIRTCLAELTPQRPAVPFYTTVLDDPRAMPAFDAAYWASNLRRPVRFAPACAAALADGHRTFIEISAHPVALPAVRENAAHAGREVRVLPSLTRGHVDATGLRAQVAVAHCAGVPVRWPTEEAAELADVPLPKWARRPLWMPEAVQRAEHTGERSQHGRPLLGPHIAVPDGLDEQHMWQSDVGTGVYPWLGDHRVYGAPAMAGAGYVEMLLAAAADLFGEAAPCEISDLAFHALLRLDAHTTVTTRATGREAGTVTVDVLADGDGRARPVASAALRRLDAASNRTSVDVPAVLAGQGPCTTAEPVFASARSKGVEHGPDFAGLTAVYPPRSDPERVVCRVELPARLRAGAGLHRLHTVLLDACMQTLCAHPDVMGLPATLLPLGIGAVRLLSGRCACWCLAQVHEADSAAVRADVTLLADDGTVVAELLDVQLGHSAGHSEFSQANQRLLAVEWQPEPLGTNGHVTRGRWLVVTEDEDSDDPLAQALTRALNAGRVDVTLAASVADAVAESVSAGTCSGLVMLCPPSPLQQDVAAVGRARDRVRRLIQVVRAVADSPAQDLPRLYVLIRDGTLEQSALRGLCRVVSAEHPELRITHVDVAVGTAAADVAAELLADTPEDEIAWRDGIRRVARLRPARLRDDERHSTEVWLGRDGVELTLRDHDDPGSVQLRARPRSAPRAGQVEICVHAAGLSFSDDPAASGDPIGLDCAGEITALGPGVTDLRLGDRVAAFAPGALGSFVLASADTVFGVPAAMSYTEAATLPTAQLTARYALHYVARLGAGEHVLIHSGAGPVGQAAIAFATATGAVVHATASSETERDVLRVLGVANISDSHDLDFADEVRAATDGRGVDVVLNSLSGAALRTSLDLLRPGGRFIELGKSDIDADHRLGLGPFRRNLTFASVDMAQIAAQLPDLARALTTEVGAELDAGRIAPVAHTTYPLERLTDALNAMATGTPTGKLVITIPQHGSAQAAVPPEQVTLARRDGAYVITGGLGGLGLLLARDLAEQGAGCVVLNGRGRPSRSAAAAIEELRQGGADIAVVLGDIADPATAPRLIAAARLPVRGIAHAAANVIDATVIRIDDDLLDRVWQAKTVGAWHLHHASLDQPLDWWLGFSSAATLIGNAGQGAYAAANGWLDAFTSYRRAQGLPAHSIQWGAWADHGRGAGLAERGFTMISPTEGLSACRTILRHNRAHTAYVPLQDAYKLIGDRLHAVPFFAALARRSGTTRETADTQHSQLRADLRAADPPTACTMLIDLLLDRLAAVLQRNRGALDPDASLADIGLDSLMALELRTYIATVLGIQFPARAIWRHATVAGLAAHLASHFHAVEAPSERTRVAAL